MEGAGNQKWQIAGVVLGVVEVALIVACGVVMSQLSGNADTSNDLSKTVLPITGTLGGIVLIHSIMWYIYFTYNPLSVTLYMQVAMAMCMCISLTALSIAIVNKN